MIVLTLRGLALSALPALAGCAHNATVVGTWTRDHEMTLESGGPDPSEGSRFITYSADGTFHLELYGTDSPDPTNQLKGTYKLSGNHLTTYVVDTGAVNGKALLTDATATVSGDNLTLSNDTVPWRRVKYPYRFVDHTLDLVGTWKDKRGATLELRPDGTFTAKGAFAEGMFASGGMGPGRPPDAEGAHNLGMVAGRIYAGDGTLVAGKGAAANYVGTVRGSGGGRYSYEGKFLTLNGSFTPSAGKDKGKGLAMSSTMSAVAGAKSSHRLRMLGGTRYENAGSFARIK